MTPATSPAKPSATSAAPASAATSTRARLLCGVLAGPLFLVVGFAQVLTRDGFDLTRHPFSFLSLGDLGWIQISNFVLSGLLFVVAATGFRWALRPGRGGTWGPLLIGAMGVGMICGGVFLPDPAYGFPAGTPDGRPDVISWHGNLHGLAFVVAILSWTAACFVFTRRFAAVEQRRWAAYSAATGVALVVPAAFLGTSVGVVLLYVAATLGWIWTTAVSARLITELESRPAVTL